VTIQKQTIKEKSARSAKSARKNFKTKKEYLQGFENLAGLAVNKRLKIITPQRRLIFK
jgi:hypothetical protein